MLAPTPAYDKGIFFRWMEKGALSGLSMGAAPPALPRGVRNELQERLKRQAATH
jgi:hypothetical protein